MKNKILYTLIILCFSLSVFAMQEIYVSYMDKPNIDGKIEEDEWAKATKLSDFHILNSSGYDINKSIVYCGYDNENIYFAYRFYGQNLPKGDLIDDIGDIWNDDSIEIFLMGDRKKEIVHQIIGNCAGGYIILSNAKKGSIVNEARMDTLDLKIDYKTFISPTYEDFGAKPEDLYWEGEMAIKLKDIDIDPKTFNNSCVLFGRDSQNNGKYNAVFGHIYKTFYEYENFSNINWGMDNTTIRVNKYDEVEIRNFNQNEKTYIINEIIKDTENKEEVFTLKPGDAKVYKGTYDKGIFQTNIKVLCDDKTYLSLESDICNVEIFKYNYDREKDILTVNFDFTGQNVSSYPYVDCKLVKDNKALVGYLLNISKEKPTYEMNIDMSKYEKGKYEINYLIKNIITDTATFKK